MDFNIAGMLTALFGDQWLAALVALLVFFERVGKAIPDDTDNGVLVFVRKLTKFLGAYITNQK